MRRWLRHGLVPGQECTADGLTPCRALTEVLECYRGIKQENFFFRLQIKKVTIHGSSPIWVKNVFPKNIKTLIVFPLPLEIAQ